MATKTAIVSGASSGIGRAICQRLLDDNYTVTGLARDFSRCAIEHPRFNSLSIDFSELDTLAGKLDETRQQFSAVDALVCCAGQGNFGSLEEFSYQQIRHLMDLNFTSQAFLTRSLLPLIKKQKSGDVIFIGSESALTGGRKGAIYSASKFALRGLAQALREECAKTGVRISIINPGMVKTGFFDDLAFEPGGSPENYILPEDIADSVAMILAARQGTVFDEINLSPQKKVIQFKKQE